MKGRNLWPVFVGWFDALKLRERALITVATLAILAAAFNTLVLQRLDARKKALSQQLANIVMQVQGEAGAASATSGPNQEAASALARARILSVSLAQATARLESQSAGLIPPERMTQVIHDVLSRQRGVELISLRGLPPYPLLKGSPDASAVGSADRGPYVHTVVLVLQGRYLDVLAYLRALESLPWHFYWRSLELDSTHYPASRVSVTLGTVSMSREWIDL